LRHFIEPGLLAPLHRQLLDAGFRRVAPQEEEEEEEEESLFKEAVKPEAVADNACDTRNARPCIQHTHTHTQPVAY